MKASNLLIVASATALAIASWSALAGAKMTCPMDFKVKKNAGCTCTSASAINCPVNGELMYVKNTGVDVAGTTLKTSSGASVNCDGSMWGVKMMHHNVGFRCQK